MKSEDGAPDQTRIVVDADVLAADVLVGDAPRVVLDTVRAHSWLDLIATDPLLSDAESVIEECATRRLATEWREAIGPLVTSVEQPAADHPALAAAYRGGAAHLVSLDDRLRSPAAGAELRGAMDVSVRSPAAFVAVFDPAVAYESAFETEYAGPDRDPRA